jgi:hypothetical protein
MFDSKSIAKKFGTIVEWLRGDRVVTDITEPRAVLESLTAHSNDGYITTIFCRENRYRCTYSHWWIPSRTIKTYHVFSVVQGKAPDILVQAYRLERTFPKLLSPWSSNSSQKEAAIEAYLDVLLVEIGRKRR